MGEVGQIGDGEVVDARAAARGDLVRVRVGVRVRVRVRARVRVRVGHRGEDARDEAERGGLVLEGLEDLEEEGGNYGT